MTDFEDDQRRETEIGPAPLDEGIGRFIDALAVALARRDHENDLVARRAAPSSGALETVSEASPELP